MLRFVMKISDDGQLWGTRRKGEVLYTPATEGLKNDESDESDENGSSDFRQCHWKKWRDGHC